MNVHQLHAFMYQVYLMIEGDDVVEEVLAAMRQHGFVDEDGFWKYDED